MFTIGTAGHVDHGKSTLVKALTGIDPDRLREEKERGMTIDLGFAWLRLPSNREVSIVDVPGHERFIKNMLAGVGGIDLALFVVAADEGVMPQTEEHLAILDLLRVKRGAVAITKRDMVEAEWLEMVIDDLKEHLKGTVLDGAPMIPVSALTGDGLPQLLETLDGLLADTTAKTDKGRARLPIDRVFTIAGFGTVVTGTLIDGTLQAGQEVEVLPGGLRSRIRGLQTHKHKVEKAAPGNRVAVNLANVATSDLQRGNVVAAPRWLRPSRALDVRLRLLRSAPKPLEHNATVTFHTGATETVAKVALLEKAELAPGEEAWAQLRLAEQIAVVKGDLGILRTPNETIGGAEVVEPHPKRHRRFQTAVVETLAVLQRGSPEDLVAQALEARLPIEARAVVERSGVPADIVQQALASLVERRAAVKVGDYYVAAATWSRLVEQLHGMLAAHHRQFRFRGGMPKEELKSRLALPQKLFNEVVARLTQERRMVADDSVVRLPEHDFRLSPDEERDVSRLMAELYANRYSPPSGTELEERCRLDPELVNALVERGKLAKVGDNILFPMDVYQEMVDRVTEFARAHGKITVAEVRDLFGTSRKYALALMEHLDERHITRRIGDERVLR